MTKSAKPRRPVKNSYTIRANDVLRLLDEKAIDFDVCAKACDVDRKSLDRWLKGSGIRLSNLRLLAEALGVDPPGDLLSSSGDRPIRMKQKTKPSTATLLLDIYARVASDIAKLKTLEPEKLKHRFRDMLSEWDSFVCEGVDSARVLFRVNENASRELLKGVCESKLQRFGIYELEFSTPANVRTEFGGWLAAAGFARIGKRKSKGRLCPRSGQELCVSNGRAILKVNVRQIEGVYQWRISSTLDKDDIQSVSNLFHDDRLPSPQPLDVPLLSSESKSPNLVSDVAETEDDAERRHKHLVKLKEARKKLRPFERPADDLA